MFRKEKIKKLTLLSMFLSIGTFCALFFILNSCDDENAFDCVKSAGKTVEKEISMDSIKGIILYDDVELYLSQGDEQKVILKTGENLAKKIKFSYKDGDLSIRNENKCNWVRKYKDVKVYITCDTSVLSYLKTFGHGNIKSLNCLFTNNIFVEAKNATGDIDLELNCEKIDIVTNTISNIALKGKTQTLSVSHFYGDGKFIGDKLFANDVVVEQLGTNTISVYPLYSLSVTINGKGNVFYYNDPQIINVSEIGKGGLVRKY